VRAFAQSASVILVDIVRPSRLSFWQGSQYIFWGIGGSCGGVFGGVVQDIIGWRWSFLLQLPVVVACGACIAIVLEAPTNERKDSDDRKSIDVFGIITIIPSVILLTTAISLGGHSLAWSSPFIIGSLIGSAVLLIAFFYVEDKVAQIPILPLSILKQRNVWCTMTLQLFGAMCCIITQFYLPLYLSVVRGYDARSTGLQLIPMSLSISLAGLLSGTLMLHMGKSRYIFLIMLAFLIQIVSALMFCFLSPTTSMWYYLLAESLFGLGECAWNTISLVIMIESVEKSEVALANSSLYTGRGIGTPLGLAIATALFQFVLRDSLRAKGYSSKLIEEVSQNSDIVRHLPTKVMTDVLSAYSLGTVDVFILSLVIGFIAWSAAFLLRSPASCKHR